MAACPAEPVLRAYLADQIGPSEAEAIDVHIGCCPACQAALERLNEQVTQGFHLGYQPAIQLVSPDDEAVSELKQKLSLPLGHNGAPDGRPFRFLDPPNRDGEIGALGPFGVRAFLGRGGTANVFKGTGPDGKVVALKVLLPEFADGRNRERFVRGGKLAIGVRDQHVVEVFSVGDPPDRLPYLAMEYIEGETLHDRIRRERRLAPRTIAEIVRQAARGLQSAHERKIIHRDVKSTNILLDRTTQVAKLADFGLARHLEVPSELTRQGEVCGTPEFMSQEQLRSPESVDERTDIYGMGVVLYHALTGELPFRGSLLGLLKQVLEDDPVPPRRLIVDLPRDLETICLKCLEKEPRRRYASAAAMGEDLDRFLNGRSIRARPPGVLERGTRWASRHPAWAAASVCGLVALLGSTGGAIYVNQTRADAAQAVARAAGARQAEAEARAVAEHSRSQTQEREALIQQMQRIRLTSHRYGWSSEAWTLARRAAGLEGDDRVQSETFATLAGLDVKPIKRLSPSAMAVAFDPSGKRLFLGGSNPIINEPERPIHIWESSNDRLETGKVTTGETLAFGFRTDGTPLLAKSPPKESASLQLWDLAREHLEQTFHSSLRGSSRIDQISFAANGTLVGASVRGVKPNGELAGPGGIAVWQTGSGQEVFHSPVTGVSALALANDASLIAAGSEDGQIIVWTLPEGKPIASLKANSSEIVRLAFGHNPLRRPGPKPPGTDWLLAAGGHGGNLSIWDLREKAQCSLCYDPSPSQELMGLTFSPDGTTIASTGRLMIMLWDVASGELLLTAGGPGSYNTSLAFSPDGRQLAASGLSAFGSGEGVAIYEIEEGRGVINLRGLRKPSTWMTFSNDGRLVAALADDWRVGIWDRSNRRLLHVLEVSPGSFSDNATLAFSPDGRKIAVSAGHEASLWDVDTGNQLRTWTLPVGLTDQLAYQDEKRLLLFRTETESGDVGPFSSQHPSKFPRVCRVRDLFGTEPLKPLTEIRDFNWHVFHAALSLDGKYLAIEGLSGSSGRLSRVANLYEGATGKKLGPLPTQLAVKEDGAAFSFDPTGTALNYYYKGRDDPGTFFLRVPSLTVAKQIDRFVSSVGPHANRYLVGSLPTADSPGSISLLEEGRNSPLARLVLDLRNPWGAVGKPVFSPDGQYIAWGTMQGVTVVDLVAVQRRLAEIGMGW
jgi:WD40 repeat protein